MILILTKWVKYVQTAINLQPFNVKLAVKMSEIYLKILTQ